MELSLQYHPSEILRKLQLMWSEFWNDQDFRYPELRHRLGIELSFRSKTVEIQDDAKKFIEPILEEFDRSQERVPFIDFWMLWEWNERYQLASTWIEMTALKNEWKNTNSPLAAQILERVRLMENELLNFGDERDPGWTHLIRLRWRNAALRDELRYFRSLLKEKPAK